MSIERAWEQPNEPEEDDILRIAVEELDHKNTHFFEAVRIWTAAPSAENITRIAETGVVASNAFQGVIETVMWGDITPDDEEKSVFLAGIAVSNDTKRLEEFKKIVPDGSYREPIKHEKLSELILRDLEQEVLPEVICQRMYNDHIAGLNEDTSAIFAKIATTKKGIAQHSWDKRKTGIAEFGKQVGANTAALVLSGLILKKLWDRQ